MSSPHPIRSKLIRWWSMKVDPAESRYPKRSRALQSAVNLLSERERRTRLARELAKIDSKEEKRLAEEGLGDRAWPLF